VYSTFLGGSAADFGSSVAVDTSGRAYVTGWTTSTNFPTLDSYDGSWNGGVTFGDAFATSSSQPEMGLSTAPSSVVLAMTMVPGSMLMSLERPTLPDLPPQRVSRLKTHTTAASVVPMMLSSPS